jgi:hypothetical protein
LRCRAGHIDLTSTGTVLAELHYRALSELFFYLAYGQLYRLLLFDAVVVDRHVSTSLLGWILAEAAGLLYDLCLNPPGEAPNKSVSLIGVPGIVLSFLSDRVFSLAMIPRELSARGRMRGFTRGQSV